jgi:hypothetical protein
MIQYFILLPFIHFFALYFISLKRSSTKYMMDLWAIPYLDWFFVPFNYFLVSAIEFSWTLFGIFLVVSLAGTIYIHSMGHPREGSRKKLFFKNQKQLTPEGWVHFAFMVIQGALIFTALVSRAVSISYIFVMVSLFCYLLGFIVIIKFIRKNIKEKPEAPFLYLGILLVLGRIILYFLF